MNMIDPISARSGSSGARRALLLVLVLVAWVALGNGTAASSGPKTYTADFTVGLEDPAVRSVAAGAVETFYATLTNKSDNQNLGSANIYPPTGFELTGTAFIEAGSSGTATVPNGSNVVEVRNLSLAPGSHTIVAFEAEVPCTPGTVSWRTEAKQANTFNGPPGNDFTLIEPSNLEVDVTAACALRFLSHPTHAEDGETITSVPLDPKGQPAVQVEVIDGSGERVTSSSANITVTLLDDREPQPGATLSGTKTKTAMNGVATYDDLSIDLHGSLYRLKATSPGFTEAISDRFGIWEEVMDCDSDESCTANLQEAGSMEAGVTTTSPSAGSLLMSLGADTLTCHDSSNHAPSVVTVDSVGLTGEKTVTLTVDKQVDQQQPQNGVSFYEVCYQGDDPDEDPHLLLDCKVSDAPCVASKTKTKAGDVQIVVKLPPGDPRML